MELTKSTFPRVFAYLRFSSDGQSDGNSFARQREGVTKRLKDLGLSGVPVQWLEDPGVSAFKGAHLKAGELGKFLAQVRSGSLPKNCLFVCETVSRASRQGAFALLTLLNTLLDADFSVLFLDQPQPFKRDRMPKFLAVQLTLLADLAQEESKLKSDFAKDNWSRRRAAARADPGKVVFTGECPNWLEVVEGRYRVIADRAEAIRELYRRALDGDGISKLVRYANTKPLPAPGKVGSWHTSLIKRVLTNRALIGEFQPYLNEGRQRIPQGEPIQDFYPQVIDPDLFRAVQALRAKAAKFPSRRDDNNFNYLRGLAKCACGGSWRRLNKNSGAQEGYALYGCSNRVRAMSDCPNINARQFDHSFVAYALTSIPEMLAAGENPRGEQLLAIEAQLAETAAKKARLMAIMESEQDLKPELVPRFRQLTTQERELAKELEALQAQEAPPPGFSFDEALEVFLPAYLDVYPKGSAEFDDAFRARTLFRARIIQSVASVSVSKDRKTVALRLKNGAEGAFSIEQDEVGDAGYGAPDDHGLSASEQSELAETRATQLRLGRRISNVSKKG